MFLELFQNTISSIWHTCGLIKYICRVSKGSLNTCTWEYCSFIMKVKVRTVGFSVLKVDYVKRYGRIWEALLLKVRYVDGYLLVNELGMFFVSLCFLCIRTFQIPCFLNLLMSKMSIETVSVSWFLL